MTRPEETAEIRLGPLSVEVRNNERARGGGPLTSDQRPQKVQLFYLYQ